MERPIVTLPQDFLRFLNVDWDIDWRGQGLGETTGGGSATVYNKFPRWVGSPTIYLKGTALAQWRAIRATAQGRLGIYRLPMLDPVGIDPGQAGAIETLFDDGAGFDSGTGFADQPLCFASMAADPGAEQIRVENAAVAPVAGQIMSHGHWPFVVTWVSEVSAGVFDLGVQMPLRAGIAIGDPIQLQGEGLFEAVEGSMGRPSYGVTRLSTLTLNFREVLNR